MTHRSITRRGFVAATAAGAASSLARPAIAQNSLKGTKLTILVGQFYVPENNTQLDQLAVDLAKDTGMEIHVERLAGDELGVKTMAVIGSGRGADISIGVEFDTYLYAPKLADVTDLAEEIGKNYGGWFEVAKQACIHGCSTLDICEA